MKKASHETATVMSQASIPRRNRTQSGAAISGTTI